MDFGKKPEPPQIAPDPMFDRLQNQAANDETNAMKSMAQGDYASLLARYGSLIALAGNKGTSPLLGSPITKSVQSAGMK